jgi:hypothetical protein
MLFFELLAILFGWSKGSAVRLAIASERKTVYFLLRRLEVAAGENCPEAFMGLFLDLVIFGGVT